MKYKNLTNILKLDKNTTEKFITTFVDLHNRVNFNDTFEKFLNNREQESIKKVLEFIFRCKFTTHNQVVRYIQLENLDLGDDVFDFMVENDLVQRCVLGNYRECEIDNIPKESIIYLISRNGTSIISGFTCNTAERWNIREFARSGSNIIRDIQSTEILLNIMKAYGTDAVYSAYVRPASRNISATIITFNLEVVLNVNGQLRCFLINIIDDEDFKCNFALKISRLESYINTNSYKKSCLEAKPQLLFVCKDDITAIDLSKRLRKSVIQRNSCILTISKEKISSSDLILDKEFIYTNPNSEETVCVELINNINHIEERGIQYDNYI